jgi:hypothetical protein
VTLTVLAAGTGFLSALCITQRSAVAQQAPAAPSPAPALTVEVGFAIGDRDRWDGVVFRGQPLEIVVSLSNAAVWPAYLHYQSDLGDRRAQAAAHGDPLPVDDFDAASLPAVVLPAAGRGWIDCVEIQLVRLDEAASAGLAPAYVVVSPEDFRVLLGTVATLRIVELRDGPASALITLPPERTGGFTPGMYRVEATYDSSAAPDERPDLWRGKLLSNSSDFQLRQPDGPRERMATLFWTMTYQLKRGANAQAIASAQAILDIDPSYYDGGIWLYLGDAKRLTGDLSGARSAWDEYARRRPADTERIADLRRLLASSRGER